VLRDAGTLDNTLHHELMHMLIDSYARAGTPRWFREGVVLYLTSARSSQAADSQSSDVASLEAALRAPQSQQQLRAAYVQAQALVAELAQKHGKEVLLEWIQNGLPADLQARISTARDR